MDEIDHLLIEGFQGNVTALRTLQLLCRFSTDDAAAFCLVSPETFRRWRTDRAPNPLACKLLSIRAGYLPWPEWRDWRMTNGLLIPPGWAGRGVSSGEVAALPYLHQLVSALQRQKAEAPAGVSVADANPAPLALRRRRQRAL